MAAQTLTALYNDSVPAETAIERLRAIGLPEGSLEMHHTGDGDVLPGNAPSGGLFTLGDILSNRTDDRQITAAATVVVALHVPHHLVAEATDILEDESIEVDKSSESD